MPGAINTLNMIIAKIAFSEDSVTDLVLMLIRVEMTKVMMVSSNMSR